MWKSGEQAKFGFLVIKGSFKFHGCKEAEHAPFENGAFIGECNAMINSEPLTTTAKAVTDGLIFAIKKEDLLGFLEKNPGLMVLFQDVKYFE